MKSQTISDKLGANCHGVFSHTINGEADTLILIGEKQKHREATSLQCSTQLWMNSLPQIKVCLAPNPRVCILVRATYDETYFLQVILSTQHPMRLSITLGITKNEMRIWAHSHRPLAAALSHSPQPFLLQGSRCLPELSHLFPCVLSHRLAGLLRGLPSLSMLRCWEAKQAKGQCAQFKLDPCHRWPPWIFIGPSSRC